MKNLFEASSYDTSNAQSHRINPHRIPEKEMSKEDLLVWHLRDFDVYNQPSRYAVTIVMKTAYYGEYLAVMNFGMSFCSKDDQFSKKSGRAFALKRIKDVHYFSGQIDIPEKHMSDRKFIFFAVASKVLISKGNQIPKFAKKLIRDKMTREILTIQF